MNPFQSQYPLSPRKFWKKFIPTIIPTIIGGLAIGLAIGLIPFFTSSAGGQNLLASLLGTCIMIAIAAMLLIFGWNIWYYKTYIRTYLYNGEDNFMTIKKGVFTPREIHIQYQKVQDVYVDQDLLDRIMGLYDVHIASATVSSGMEAHIDGVEKATADGLKNFILTKIQAASGQVPGSGLEVGGMPSSAIPVQAQAAPQFQGNISSATYPIQGRWLPSQVITIAIYSAFIGLFAGGYGIAKTDGGSGIFTFWHIFIAVAVLWFIFHFIAQMIWKSNYAFAFLPEYIQLNTGILSRSERHLPYKSIQDVSVAQSLPDRIFGLANVVIENAAQMQMVRGRSMSANIKLVGLNPVDAKAIVESLKGVILTKNSSQMGL